MFRFLAISFLALLLAGLGAPVMCADDATDAVDIAKAKAVFLLRLADGEKAYVNAVLKKAALCAAEETGACDCKDCKCAVCVEDSNECVPDLSAALRKAEKTGKPLVIWVPKCNEEYKGEFADCVNCHQSHWHGNMTSAVVFKTPSGWYTLAQAHLDAKQVAGIRDRMAGRMAATAPIAVQRQFQQFMPFSGGGCAGGRCR